MLVGTFAYLAYDRSTSAGTDEVRSTQTDAASGQKRPKTAGDDPRSLRAPDDEPVAPGASQPSPEPRTAPSQPSAPAGAGAEGSSVSPGAVPAYDAPLRESRAGGVTEVVVGTEAKGEDEMRLVASDLASYYPPGDGVLLVEFREGVRGSASTGKETGFALVFGSRKAASAPDLDYTEQEVDEIFEEDGGVRAVSYEEFGEENPALKDDLERIRTY